MLKVTGPARVGKVIVAALAEQVVGQDTVRRPVDGEAVVVPRIDRGMPVAEPAPKAWSRAEPTAEACS